MVKLPASHLPDAETPDWVRQILTPHNPDAAIHAATTLVQAVDRTLNVACALAASGRPVSLAGLQNWVGQLTASVLDLDAAHRHDMRLALVGLITSLDRLEHALQTRAPPEPQD